MNKILNALFCGILAAGLSGCVEKEILDDINLVTGIGFDYSEKGKIRGTVVIPVFLPDKPPSNKTFTAESDIKKTILQDIEHQAADPIVTGSIEVILFSKELAEKQGILELIDAFQRDPGVGSGIYLVVVDGGETKDLLEGSYGVRGTAIHLSDLIDHNIKHEDMPQTNLHIFLSAFYLDGKTPFMPEIKQISEDKVELSGISFFKYGKIVSSIPNHKMFFFKLLVDKYSEGLQMVTIDEGHVAIQSIHSSHNFKLTKQEPTEITIDIKVEGVINEFSGNKLTAKTFKKVKTKFEKLINQECTKLIHSFQEKEIDPIGLGRFVKTQTRNFDQKKWESSQYKNIVVKVKSEVKIREAGVIK